MNSKTASPANDVEMKPIQRDAPKGSIPLGEDIMQLARIGEIGAMQNMFATKKLTANHRDEEGITPLHVCFRSYYPRERRRGHRYCRYLLRSERESYNSLDGTLAN
jgi:hypothetical protein